ncbi:WD repeat-containing protein 19 [Nilaparvata lugens]|uniref:WD repeat-containing protein 19 n=1 Tax=Nilaparvata lugens TaxID=108931 RepID=UPI00193D7063|nr:WD repeat-containing protein 19 [Nilaparvata lugens]
MSHEKELFNLEHPHGHGAVQFAWQKGSGNYLATTGQDCSLSIYNRLGNIVQKLQLPGVCLSLSWDSDGDLLGVICNGNSSLILWDANTTKRNVIETRFRDALTCLIWAKNGPTVAVATARGNVVIYHHSTTKRIPILGKHTKAITSGDWSNEGLLALGSEDRTLSISSADGDSLRVIQLRSEPAIIQFSEMKTDERASGENTVSVIVGKKTLFLYNLQDPENPIELAFQPRYGNIVTYKWFGDGYILVGFSLGYMIAISTHIREVGQELFQVKNHRDVFSDIAVSQLLGKIASCGDNLVKIHEMSQLGESPVVMSVDDEAGVDRVAYSEDGQLLGVSTGSGHIRVFLTRLPMLAVAHGNTIALLTALTQLTLHQLTFQKGKSLPTVTLEMEVEPSFLAIGPFHIVGGMNNRAWLYELSHNVQSPSDFSPTTASGVLRSPQLISDHEYLGTIKSICLNSEYTSALFEGKLQLHLTEPLNGAVNGFDHEGREMKLFPEEGEHLTITCHALSAEFLIYASDMGHLRYFLLEDWTQAIDYRHTVGINEIFPDHSGTKVIVIDSKNDGYLYNPVMDQMMPIPNFPSTATGAIWDLWHSERNLYCNDYLKYTLFIYNKIYFHVRKNKLATVRRPTVSRVGETKVPLDQKPLVLHAGELTLETSGGQLNSILLSSHQMPTPTNKLTQSECFELALDKRLELLRFQEAWNTCISLGRKQAWQKLVIRALHCLEIDFAIRVYRHIKDVGMAHSLERVKHIEDKKLLAGHVAMFLQDFDRAQLLFLESSNPIQALIMRQDILQWDQALQLARSLDPSQIPFISREYAQQLELTGQYTEALSHYERGLTEEGRDEEHNSRCRAGIARTAIRCGDYRRGIAMATDPRADQQLKQECAEILQATKKLNEAALLYEKAENFDQAASAYINLKNWHKVGELLPKVTSPKIHHQYGKVKEAMGEYRIARQAYQMANDLDSIVRLDLDHLNDPQGAVRIVQETRSIEGAKMIAKFFQKIGDYVSAIRFLVMSKCHNEAFRLSRDHNHLELYGDILVEEFDGEAKQEFQSLAMHFESLSKFYLCGKYYYHAGEYKKALKNLLIAARSNPDDEEAISLAIDVVGTLDDDIMANQLIELLLGEADGVARDPKYIFRLYMARRQYMDAAKTAIIIAREEQVNGNYRSAHDVLLGMCQELRENNLRISTELVSNLMLLHSYILVRLHVRRGSHLNAARMLIRVADNISKFPSRQFNLATFITFMNDFSVNVPCLSVLYADDTTILDSKTSVEAVLDRLDSSVERCREWIVSPTPTPNLEDQSSFSFTVAILFHHYPPTLLAAGPVEPKYKKKIEGVVRKPPRGANNKLAADEPEPVSPCPFCEQRLPQTELYCNQCKNNIPFCIATGRHIVKGDLTVCPHCRFPAIRSELLQLVESGENCPMCSEHIELHDLKLKHDPLVLLQPSDQD